MSDVRLVKTRLRAGVWEGVLSGTNGQPALEVLHLEAHIAGVSVTEVADCPGTWAVRVPIPAEALSEGVQTFLIREAASGDKLAHFTIITGVVMEDDIRAEMDLLRAELDMLKRAFRRHCLETMG
ncbi:hypothetical protein SAMN05216227_1001144 [Pseudorhodobacter antarcticus]|jgi:hypothetical protein|uniref:Uncharacterized protein n=1 Tax=Pseudorhodobacter antarcticus TaxID=1077947 RepID=A0A1H8AHL6_9RHOB|nr:hypothetical protein [Pseudorhodobacter antarcticus]SEM70292.1 hypothetical protein SAMN05216227_1001144 [Pseudorhodobacter antarcticus]